MNSMAAQCRVVVLILFYLPSGVHQTLCGLYFRDTHALRCFAGYTFATPMRSYASLAILSRHPCLLGRCCPSLGSVLILIGLYTHGGSLFPSCFIPFRERTKRFVGYTFATPVLSDALPAILSRRACSQMPQWLYFREIHALLAVVAPLLDPS